MSPHFRWMERSRERQPGEKTQRGVTIVAVGLLVGMVIVSFTLARTAPESQGTSGTGTGLAAFLLFVAAAAVGAVVGFLFGLPRSRPDQPQTNTSGSVPSSATSPTTHFLANSNLIKVSDWLTTIIIGLGLVNLGSVIPATRELGAALKAPLGGAAYAGGVGISIVISGALTSFVLMYLWTSIRVRELMESSEDYIELHIPDVKGMTVAKAKEAFGATSLKLVPPLGANDQDIVATQSSHPGETVFKGAEVNVTLQ